MRRFSVIILCCTFLLTTSLAIRITSAQAQQPLLSFNPLKYEVAQADDTFELNLMVENVENLWGWTTAVTWDVSYLLLVGSPTEGDFLKQAGATFFVAAPSKNGIIPEITCGIMSAIGVGGSGVLAKLTFKVTKECVDAPILLVNATLLTPESDPSTPSGHKEIDHQIQGATVTLVLGGKPVAYAGSPQTVNEGTQITFNGSKSVPTEENLTFVWSFFDEDPKTLEGMIAFYTFEIPGTYNVTLTVENSKGGQSNATVSITVRDVTPPIAVIVIKNVNPGQPITIGQSITLNASQSYDPEGGKIQRYLWDLGDGTGNNPTAETITHQYTKAGTYSITLTVFDQRGNNSGSQTAVVTVGQEYSQTVKLPPMIIGILVVVTALVISGSAFWLRNRSPEVK